MRRNEQRLVQGFRSLVDSEALPSPPMVDWLPEAAAATVAEGGGPGSPALVRTAAERPASPRLAALPVARWPEDLAFKPPAGVLSTAATVALAASLALVQASGWVNPIDRGANRLLAEPTVQSGLVAAWDLASKGQLPGPPKP